MVVRIYNSLARKKEELKPIKGKVVNMYSCGVTVYDKCHIGHARSLYVFDVIKKYLQFRGYDVKLVRNITDVDDKIIKKANDLRKTFDEVVAENIALYEEDLKSLGLDRADIEPRATKNIGEMIKHIEGLIGKGYAYESSGDVYFCVKKFEGYGKLSGQSVDKMLEGVRIDPGEKKKDQLDFVLWKKSKENEPSWPSPWGDGRPGWHIECSCMSMKYLDCETLDIHAGGRDLIFPHHENEIAQSEALTGKKFANCWIHHGLLTINGQKMAKSLGNFITVSDAVKKYPVDDLKMLFLSSHYTSPVDFSEERMIDAHKALERIKIFLSEVEGFEGGVSSSAKEPEFIADSKRDFEVAMDDDFNTPKALSVIFDLISSVYKLKEKDSYQPVSALAYKVILDSCNGVFGILKQNDVSEDAMDEINSLINERAEARVNKDFQRSDEIRDKLKDMGIIVEDGKDGQKWRRA